MTNTQTCKTMNGYYEILKGCTVREIEAMRRIYQDEQTRDWQTAVYCCGEAIRRKNAGIWK
jgi:hypothetical protein